MQIHIDIQKMSYRALNEFSSYMSKAQLEQAFNAIRPFIAKWDMEISLSSEDPFGELSIEEAGDVLRAIASSITSYVTGLQEGENPYSANLSKWKNRQVLNFIESARKGDMKTVEEAICEVVTISGVVLTTPLSVREGVGGMRAIMDAYQKALSAKN